MPPRLDWLARLLNDRPLTVRLDEATERRVRAHMDRVNRELGEDPLDLDDDGDVAIALMGLVEGGLEAAEQEHGLAGTIFGDLLSRDVMDEGVRRRREQRRRGG